jgi:hypothetical protein
MSSRPYPGKTIGLWKDSPQLCAGGPLNSERPQKGLTPLPAEYSSRYRHTQRKGRAMMIRDPVTQIRFGNIPILSALSLVLASTALQAGVSAEAGQPGSAASGEALFIGRVPFKNGGPGCASCHSIAGVPFPNGGRLGPDLTGAYEKFGPEGTDFVLQTLFFPTMAPIFGARPLTTEEQRDLKAFLAQTRPGTSVQVTTLIIFSLAFLGYLVLTTLSWALWRRRLLAVREPLVRKSMSTGGLQS